MSVLYKLCKFKIDLSYIGTNYCGFASQPNGSTIQEAVEKALSIMLREKVRVFGSSRTDSGVHAEHQVVVFSSRCKLQKSWVRSLNAILPNDIAVKSITSVSDSFHPVYSAQAKVYRYRIWKGFCTSPFALKYVWEIPSKINVKRMNDQAQLFCGLHDFTSFCALDSGASTHVREVLEFQIEERGDLVEFWVIGRGFLKQMIRIMVGTLVDINFDRLKLRSIDQILQARSRKSAGQTAPSRGLSLVKIEFTSIPKLKVIKEEAIPGFFWAI